MIKPKQFTLADFADLKLNQQQRKALELENLKGSDLIDNMIILKYCTTYDVQVMLKQQYGMSFAWLNNDNTPPEFKEIAEKHHVIIEKGRVLAVYIPLGQAVDEAMLQIDIPNYQIVYRFIADCNYRMLYTHLTANVLSGHTLQLHPLLIFRTLVIACQKLPATDLHFESVFLNKQAVSRIRYRFRDELVYSEFLLDLPTMRTILEEVISKLTPTSAMDLDAQAGVSTDVRNLFDDGTTDVRVTGYKVKAGYYYACRIQNVNTTSLKIDELGFTDTDVKQLLKLARRRSGLTLVTGKMRSGKNTTIFGMLNEIKDDPIRIMEYSYPVENYMGFPQADYQGDMEKLANMMRLAKKMDIDVAVLNEIPNADIAFAVRDLVNSAVHVMTTTHIDRAWNLPLKLQEYFGRDYKTIISQLNAVVNQRMFKRWFGGELQKRVLVKEQSEFAMQCYKAGVRQYFVPVDESTMQYALQPLMEVVVFTPEMKTAMLNFDEIWKSEQMIHNHLLQHAATLEHVLAQYVNAGLMSIEEFKKI